MVQVLLQDALDDLAKRTSLTPRRVMSGAPERVVDLHGEVRPPPGRRGGSASREGRGSGDGGDAGADLERNLLPYPGKHGLTADAECGG